MNENVLLVNKKNGIATLTLNRPAKFNALSEELLDQLLIELAAINTDSSINVVVIAANGRAFCAGHDLKQMRKNHASDYYQKLFSMCSTMMQQITTLRQPVIASVNGMATAAGCQLVATCDLAIAAETAKFGVSGINLGLFCSTPSVALSRNISRKRALELLLTGDFIDAATATDYGLINHYVAEQNLESAVAAMAHKIANKPIAALNVGKKLFYDQLPVSLSTAYELASDVMACNMMDAQTVEMVDAFLNKTPKTPKQ